MYRRKRRRRAQGEVELNLAAMLDMAFQLLAFFILTFRPSPLEGQINLHLPPPQPVTVVPDGKAPGSDDSNLNPLQGLNTLVITAFATPDGRLKQIGVAGSQYTDLDQFSVGVRGLIGDTASAFDQVVIQASSDLSYQSLMSVVDICTQIKLSDGRRLEKLGFAEIPNQ